MTSRYIVLTSLGFTQRRRTSDGWRLNIDRKTREQIHALMTKYGIDNVAYLPADEVTAQCDLCNAGKKPGAAAGSEEKTSKPPAD